ncbi:HAD-IIIC family phosphatase [Paenibacillus cymbidii]|uniref:HAD-IIIC family phosphatase n=1 Tax=Paenibacillus cymbidii TaxID=1639034 RepID=UPI001F2E6BA4|nr:HAD-IIIC family phosphatase [Paenibacillus cymbidii]
MQMEQINAINLLLGSSPARKSLKPVDASDKPNLINIQVDRTMPFEFIGTALPSFGSVWGVSFNFTYSDYDPALSQINVAQELADIHIMWLDWRIYQQSMSAQQAVNWLEDRIRTLRLSSTKPILINNWPEQYSLESRMFSSRTEARGWVRSLNSLLEEAAERNTATYLIDLAYLKSGGDLSFFDGRNDLMSKYPFSDKASILIAQHLGLQIIPALLLPRLKAIALDLDDTLYRGVLGEDKAVGVKLTEGHLHLQHLLLKLKQSGIMLTICSRNEEADVRELFQLRQDFPLKWEDFAAVSANWSPKADNIQTLAKRLNIDASAFLFLDDNPAELLKAAAFLPQTKLLLADEDANSTTQKLSIYPGVYQLRVDDAAALRTADIQAFTEREKLKQNAGSLVSYLESLRMVVRIYENYNYHISRLHEMSHKTNQFNLALKRIGEWEANEYMLEKDKYCTFTIGLEDALSDSGIIGAFIASVQNDKAIVLEVLFSCRALGREIETIAFHAFLKRLLERGCKELDIHVTQGDRNQPARQWISKHVTSYSGINLAKLHETLTSICHEYPVKLEVVQS